MRLFSTAFYMAISILGLSVISLAALIGIQFYREKLSLAELHGILRVIGGADRIMLPSEEYRRFQIYSRDEARARAELEENRGLPQTREPAVMRAEEARAAQREDLETANRLLEEQKRVVERLRSEVEARIRQIRDLTAALDDEKKRNAQVESDAATAKLRKTLAEMDAGDIAAFLTNIVRDPSQGGPPEAARLVRQHLKADFSAEVLGEMPEAERQRVLPLLENRYAGVPPPAVTKSFSDEKTSLGEQLIYLLQMNPQQALGVYLRLPPEVQEKMAPEILRM
jgi:flagellar motility protein MotE (MotC chaperone)